MKFCTHQDSTAVSECAKFVSDQVDVREDINNYILIEFEKKQMQSVS